MYVSASELVTFVAVDRVPYRMMIYILFISWLYTCYKIPIVLKRVYGKKFFVGFFILFIYFNLSFSTNSWFTRHRLENQVSEIFIIENNPVAGYESFVILCLFLTILSWIALIFYAMVFRRKTLLPQ